MTLSSIISILSAAVSILSLNGKWTPVPTRDADADHVWYSTNFELKDGQYPKAVLCLKARYNVEVWVNGKHIGYDANCSYSHTEFEIGDALNNSGQNEILVKMGGMATASMPARENESAWNTGKTAGIWDDSYISFEKKPAIRHMQLIPDLEKEIVTARVCLRTSPGEKSYVCAEILDGQTIVSQKKVVMTNTDLYEMSVPAAMLSKWAPGNAKLYSLRMSIYSKDELVAQRTERFGYRSIRASEDGILLNGEKVSESSILRVPLGEAISSFYDEADEKGLLIVNDCRFSRGTAPEGRDWEDCYTEFQRLVLEYCNHPSIISWDQGEQGNRILSGMIREFSILDPCRVWAK